MRFVCRALRTVPPLPWVLRKGLDFPRGGLACGPCGLTVRVLRASPAQPDPAPVAPPAGRGGRGPSTRRSAAPQAPMLSAPGRVQHAVFLSPASPTFPRAGWGAPTSGCCPPVSPGLLRPLIRLRVGLERWSSHAAPGSSFPESGRPLAPQLLQSFEISGPPPTPPFGWGN